MENGLRMSRREALAALAAPVLAGQSLDPFDQAKENGVCFEHAVSASQRVLHAWLRHADPRTLLLPDRVGDREGKPLPAGTKRLYTPHNSGADLYPYLILTAQLTDPELYRGRMMEMLRNEIRYTTVQESIPANLDLATGELGPPSLFGAGEYAKDGLIAVTEYLGRTPWFYRMVDMIADAMNRAPVPTRFGNLPASDAELNGDYLQALVRLATMTGDPRFLAWARRIGDAYIEEVLPGKPGVPGFAVGLHQAHRRRPAAPARSRQRDGRRALRCSSRSRTQLGNAARCEIPPRSPRMLDRILASANPDGMLYNEVDAATSSRRTARLSDNWGYVYGAVYTFYQCTGETKYRDAVRRVLRNLPKYRNYVWEPQARASPARLVRRIRRLDRERHLPGQSRARAGSLAWIDSEMKVMLAMQQPDGHIEDWYGEGNFNRTALLYAYMKSQGVRPRDWATRRPSRRGPPTASAVPAPRVPGDRAVQFDFARHRRVLNLEQNYVRLNEFPEWYTVDENTLYELKNGSTRLMRLGSEMIEGIQMAPGNWTIEPAGRAPYAKTE